MIHLHAYQQPNETRHVLEVLQQTLIDIKNEILSIVLQISYSPCQIEAHSGGVNDIAFSRPNKQLCVVTCGDDKLIKV